LRLYSHATFFSELFLKHTMSRIKGAPLPLSALPAVPVVSIAVTCYNYARFLPECLDSCLSQTVAPDQIVVIDDGSIDGSWDIISGYMARCANVHGIRQDNAGICAATNAALRACTGDVVLLIDADDVMLPRRVEAVLDALRQPIDGRLPGWAHHSLRRFSATHADLGLFSNYAEESLPHGYLAEQVMQVGETSVVTVTSGLAFRREILSAIGPLDCGRAIAQDMQLRLAAALFSPVAWIAEPLSLYRIHSASDTSGGVVASLERVKASRERHENLDRWIVGVLRKHMPEAAAAWKPLDEQPWYQWLLFLEQWWSGSIRNRRRLGKVLRHPQTRAAPIERRIYMHSSGWLPRSAFMALTRFMYGASPLKATLRRMLGRA
jgi:glycosyltransferase involved in cell wall biosynthesis